MDISFNLGPFSNRMLHLLYGISCLLTTTAFGMMLNIKYHNVNNAKRRRLYQGFCFMILLWGTPALYRGRYLVRSGYEVTTFTTMIVFAVLGLICGIAAGKIMNRSV